MGTEREQKSSSAITIREKIADDKSKYINKDFAATEDEASTVDSISDETHNHNEINGDKDAVSRNNSTDDDQALGTDNSQQKENTEPDAEPELVPKIRLVPLEKLLEKPSSHTKVLEEPSVNSSVGAVRKSIRKVLPKRSSGNKSIIVISTSSEEDEKDTNSGSNKTEKNKRVTPSSLKTRTLRSKSHISVSSASGSNKSSTVSKEISPASLSKSPSSTSVSSAKETNERPKGQSSTGQIKGSETQKQPSLLAIKKCVVRIKRCTLPEKSRSVCSSPLVVPIAEKPPTASVSSAASTSDSAETGTSSKMGAEKTNCSTRSSKRGSKSSESDSDYDVQGEEMNGQVASENGEVSDSEAAKSSDSEIIPKRKRRIFNKNKKSSSNDEDESAFEEKPKKRRRVKSNSSDSDDDDEKKKNKRKHIRKIIKTKDLDVSTLTAAKEEEERRKRIEERQKIYNKIYETPESVEVDELVLDFDEKTKKPLLQVNKGLLKKLKPHQVAGVKFMWDACFETLKDAVEKPGSGCILAHCMGLGKTLQIVSLTHTLLTNSSKTNIERVLIISPLSTLNNWAREYVYWMGFTNKKNIEIYDMSKFKDKATRIFKLNEWFEEGGVCVLGYDMYRILANEKAKGLRKKQREILQKALVDPGPDLVVCDEGHLLKNEKTSISKAVTKIRTKRRIVLTGTPLQNNLREYYCMIQFIKPNLLGTYKEYMNRFVNPITNGQYTDSTERDIRLMKHRSHILHKMLEGCMQRRDYSVLAPYLSPKYEYVVYTTLSELQQQLYEYYMTTQRDLTSSDIGGKGARLFQDFQDLRRIWTHPMNLRVNSDSVIRKRLLANDDDSMDDFIADSEEDEMNDSSSESSMDSSKSFASGGGGDLAIGDGNVGVAKTRNAKNLNGEESEIEEEMPPMPQADDPSEWWKRFVDEKELNNINHSPKLVILMRLLEECEKLGDKLLVFSQSLQSLDVIEHFLALIDNKTKGQEIEGDVGEFKGRWTPSIDYFRLDGSCSVENREAMCKKFNDAQNLRARLFLISTRAGGLGINLVAANRVVIFDVSWNPSHDTQSIFRVYRFGQEKPCYIYRLIAMGTMEQKVYERQVAKQATAKRVIDEQQISRHYNQSDLQELYTYELKPSTEREIPILPKDRLFAELLTEHETLLFKYHEHDSLLENEESENLNEDERKAAWDEYEAEKTRTAQTAQFMSYDRGAYGGPANNIYGNASGSVTTNKLFGFRMDILLQLLNMKVAKDHPELNKNQVTQMVPLFLQRLFEEMNSGDPTMYKDLLLLHSTIAHPSGMYMNPLLYANQDPGAAGYFQQPGVAQPQQPGATPVSGFEANKVYEID